MVSILLSGQKLRVATVGCSDRFETLLQDCDSFELVCAFKSAECLTLIQEHNPELCIISNNLPNEGAFQLTRKLKKVAQNKILILGKASSRKAIAAALAVGADAYCVQGITLEQLLEVVELIIVKKAWIAPVNMAVQPENLGESSIPIQASSPEYRKLVEANPLSRQELLVLQLISQGYSNREISQQLVITVGTTKTHIRNIFRKLCVDDRLSAVVQALRCGLVH